MKKSRTKLALHKETVRALSNVELSCIVGGQEEDAAEPLRPTRDRQCLAAAVPADGQVGH